MKRNPNPAEPLPAPEPPAIADPELSTLISEFIESRAAENTRRAYRTGLEDYVRTIKVVRLAEFLAAKSADVVRYRNSLQRRKLSAATVNLRLAAIRGIYRRLMKEGRIEKNPADPDLAPGLRVSAESRTEGLTFDELKTMLATCDGTLRGLRDRALLLTLYYEGLRRSEASKLNYRDITTRRGLVEVRDAKNNPYDTVRLRPEARAAIEAYLEILNRDLQKRDTKPEDPVFVSLSPIRSYGERLAADSINKVVKARAKAAGLKRRFSAHGMRHTCATHSLARGVPLHQVQRHLRHKDVRTTLRYDRERDVRKNPTTEALPSISPG